MSSWLPLIISLTLKISCIRPTRLHLSWFGCSRKPRPIMSSFRERRSIISRSWSLSRNAMSSTSQSKATPLISGWPSTSITTQTAVDWRSCSNARARVSTFLEPSVLTYALTTTISMFVLVAVTSQLTSSLNSTLPQRWKEWSDKTHRKSSKATYSFKSQCLPPSIMALSRHHQGLQWSKLTLLINLKPQFCLSRDPLQWGDQPLSSSSTLENTQTVLLCWAKLLPTVILHIFHTILYFIF